MKGISIKNFDSIFGIVPAPETVQSLREELHRPITDWKKEKPQKMDVSNIKFSSSQKRYCITSDGVDFECLFFCNNAKKLYISLGGGGRKNKIYPCFFSWKYKNFLDGDLLCIDDPMYSIINNDYVMWYYGTKDRPYLLDVAGIIKKFKQ